MVSVATGVSMLVRPFQDGNAIATRDAEPFAELADRERSSHRFERGDDRPELGGEVGEVVGHSHQVTARQQSLDEVGWQVEVGERGDGGPFGVEPRPCPSPA